MPAAQSADEATIREQAYYFWEQEGRPHGRDTEFWMRAVVAVSEQGQMETLTTPPPKSGKTKSAAASAEAPPTKSRPAKSKRAK